MNSNICLLLTLVLTIALLSDLKAAATAEQTATEAAGQQTAAPSPAAQKNNPPCAAGRGPSVSAPEGAEPKTVGAEADETADIQAMKQRYGQDPTGVRARLGMCRGGKGRQGGGPHRRFRGQNRWDAPQ